MSAYLNTGARVGIGFSWNLLALSTSWPAMTSLSFTAEQREWGLWTDVGIQRSCFSRADSSVVKLICVLMKRFLKYPFSDLMFLHFSGDTVCKIIKEKLDR